MRKKRIRDRSHETVCNCPSYRFPHRKFGGRCSGSDIIEENYGSQECRDCILNENGYCEVESGQEKTTECPLVQEFIQFNEVKIWNPKLNLS